MTRAASRSVVTEGDMLLGANNKKRQPSGVALKRTANSHSKTLSCIRLRGKGSTLQENNNIRKQVSIQIFVMVEARRIPNARCTTRRALFNSRCCNRDFLTSCNRMILTPPIRMGIHYPCWGSLHGHQLRYDHCWSASHKCPAKWQPSCNIVTPRCFYQQFQSDY